VRVSRCFVPTPLVSGARLTLPAGAAAHVRRVLRLRPGAPLTLFDGRGGEYAAEIVELGEAVWVRVGAHRAIERESPLHITLLQGVARGERMDFVVQKATELGVAAIVPLLTQHGVVRLDADGAARRREHWQAVAAGACEQCGRNRVPHVAAVSELTRVELGPGACLLLEPESERALAVAPGASALTLLIGPEGGFSAAEIAWAQAQGFLACRLGPRVLRTETAALTALAALQTLAGDLAR